MEELSLRTKSFVGLTALSGTAVLVYSLWHWQSADLTRFICYLAVALLASVLKVQLPGIDGTMSVNFLFILMGVMELSLAETLVIGCAATLLQSIWHLGKRLDPVKVIFNVAGMMANAAMQGGVLTIGIGLAEGNKSVLLSGVTTWLLGGANRLNYHANRQSREVRERLRSDRNIPRG